MRTLLTLAFVFVSVISGSAFVTTAGAVNMMPACSRTHALITRYHSFTQLPAVRLAKLDLRVSEKRTESLPAPQGGATRELSGSRNLHSSTGVAPAKVAADDPRAINQVLSAAAVWGTLKIWTNAAIYGAPSGPHTAGSVAAA